MASTLGVSLGKANYCLRALIRKGFVKVENYRSSCNKLAYFYLLTPSGVAAKAELTQRFLVERMREYEALGREIERLKSERPEEHDGCASADDATADCGRGCEMTT